MTEFRNTSAARLWQQRTRKLASQRYRDMIARDVRAAKAAGWCVEERRVYLCTLRLAFAV
jgi:hypothetical protein